MPFKLQMHVSNTAIGGSGGFVLLRSPPGAASGTDPSGRPRRGLIARLRPGHAGLSGGTAQRFRGKWPVAHMARSHYLGV